MEVKGFPNYLIFRNGSVLSKGCKKNGKPPKFLKPMQNKNHKYLQVNLRYQGKRRMYAVHRLVAEHFIKNNHNKPCVDHIDRNRQNNKISNLRWVTYKENTKNIDWSLARRGNPICTEIIIM
mgnify:CR=1 FL=1